MGVNGDILRLRIVNRYVAQQLIIEGINSTMKKKIVIVLMTALMTVLAAACGKGRNESGGADSGKQDSYGSDSAQDSVSYNIEECVTLGDYSALDISLTDTYKVTKEKIDEYAQSLAEYYAQPVYKDTDKTTVEEGDTVNIDYVGKKDGTAFENGSATGAHLTIGSNQFIPGFEDGLIGKNVGETVDLDLTFPEAYQNEELAGQDVVFTVTINKIVEKDTTVDVELTDEYVKTNLNCDTVDEYKESVKEYLKSTNKAAKKEDTRQAVRDKLKAVCEVEVPEDMLDAEVDHYIAQFKEQYCPDTSIADYLEKNFNGMKEEDFRSDITAEMKENITVDLILEAIVKAEGIELDETEYKAYKQQQMQDNGYETEEDLYKANGADAASGEENVQKDFLRDQALDLVVKNANVKYGA